MNYVISDVEQRQYLVVYSRTSRGLESLVYVILRHLLTRLMKIKEDRYVKVPWYTHAGVQPTSVNIHMGKNSCVPLLCVSLLIHCKPIFPSSNVWYPTKSSGIPFLKLYSRCHGPRRTDYCIYHIAFAPQAIWILIFSTLDMNALEIV